MADHKSTPREIEREVEQERAALQGTVEELFNRFTFEDVWNRVGAYMRDNRGDFGHSFGRMVKEKPLAVALTAVGVGWLLFGPSQAPRESEPGRRRPADGFGRDDHARRRAKLEDADFSDRRATGPSGPRAAPDPWEAPSRSPSPVAPQSPPRSPQTGGTRSPASPAGDSAMPAGTTGGTGATVTAASTAASRPMSEETAATPSPFGKEVPRTASSGGSATGPEASAISSPVSGTSIPSPGGVTSEKTGEASQPAAGPRAGGPTPVSDETDGSKDDSVTGAGSATKPNTPSP
jgi:hypothetical protein